MSGEIGETDMGDAPRVVSAAGAADEDADELGSGFVLPMGSFTIDLSGDTNHAGWNSFC